MNFVSSFPSFPWSNTRHFPTQASMEKPILFNSTSQQPFLITQNLIFLPCPSALSICHSFQIKNSSIQFEPKSRSSPRTGSILLSCQGREPVEKDQKQGDKRSLLLGLFVRFERLGKNLKENLSPKQKGDWKDLMLMSLSFAVYVYISQRIVCAYCAWMSMPNHPW